MSIARQLLHEFRPLFRMLDEPFGRRPSHFVPVSSRLWDWNHPFTDPFEGLNMLARPAVDVTEKGNKYFLDADLPGVSKENLQVRLGDGNQSITIEGQVTEKLSSGIHATGAEAKTAAADTALSPEYMDGMFSAFDPEVLLTAMKLLTQLPKQTIAVMQLGLQSSGHMLENIPSLGPSGFLAPWTPVALWQSFKTAY